MVLSRLFGRDPAREAALKLHAALATQARNPAFFATHGVPDTLDGRFDCLALHAFLVLDRLKAEEGQEAASLAQHLVDAFVEDMDRSVRELGVGDMGVARRVKQMAQALYGRSAVYSAALNDSDPAALDEALRRNLFGTVEAPPADGIAAVARYMREARGTLAATALARLTDGTPVFPEPSAAV